MGAPPPDLRLRLIAITDRRLAGGEAKLLERCARLCEAGLPALMLREKDLGARQQYELALPLRRITSRSQTLLLVNDRIDVALAVGADGVHVGGNSLPAAAARRITHHPLLLGVSCHDREQLAGAQRAGADYAFLSPVHPPRSKQMTSRPLGIESFRELISGLGIAVVGLGGISPSDVRGLTAAGAAGVAAIGAFMEEDAPEAALAAFLGAFRS